MNDPITDRLRSLLARIESKSSGQSHETGESPIRWELLPDPELLSLARNRDARERSRRKALRVFIERNQKEPAASELLLELLDDPVEGVVLEAIRRALPFDPRLIEKLRALMADPREPLWIEATRSLARRKDRAILPTLSAWFRDGEPNRRQLAIEAMDWLLQPTEKPAIFAAFWESGIGDPSNRLDLAERLLALGDERVVEFLDDLSNRGPEPLATRATVALRAWAWRDGES